DERGWKLRAHRQGQSRLSVQVAMTLRPSVPWTLVRSTVAPIGVGESSNSRSATTAMIWCCGIFARLLTRQFRTTIEESVIGFPPLRCGMGKSGSMTRVFGGKGGKSAIHRTCRSSPRLGSETVTENCGTAEGLVAVTTEPMSGVAEMITGEKF